MAEAHAKHHDYHLVNPSPWPIVGSVLAFAMAVGLIVWMRSMNSGAGLFGLRGSSLVTQATYRAHEKVRLKPFEAVEIELSFLWYERPGT